LLASLGAASNNDFKSDSNIGSNNAFNALYFVDRLPAPETLAALQQLRSGRVSVNVALVALVTSKGMVLDSGEMTLYHDHLGLLAQRFDARAGTFYLLRPDQHVVARWRQFDAGQVEAAVASATASAPAAELVPAAAAPFAPFNTATFSATTSANGTAEAPASALNIEPNIAQADDFYQALIDMHRDLSDAQSQTANARLILLLANHIGDLDVLRAAMDTARDGVAPTA
jgi:3-(3-hydroxy-phenyl)propionate hydroxylase